MYRNQHSSDAAYNGWPRDRLSISVRALVSASCLILAVGGIAYLLWDFEVVPKRVVETSRITVTIPGEPGQTVGARTRSIVVPYGRRSSTEWQVQLPDGQWIDCKRDCEGAYKSRL
ncbi:MAG: hypothetical protein AAF346_02425 [Pseudomonadota bacterium]